MPDEFKPCPFCGKPADQQVSRQSVKYAMCTDCGFSLRVSDWNTRPAEAALQAQVSALTAQNERLQAELTAAQKALDLATRHEEQTLRDYKIANDAWTDAEKLLAAEKAKRDTWLRQSVAARDALKYLSGFALDVWQSDVPQWLKSMAGIAQNVCRAALQDVGKQNV